MLLEIFIYVAVFGAIGLAIYSVYKRIKNTDENTAGYVYNGKMWVTWLFLICVLSILFYVFIMPMPLLSGQTTYHPDWNYLGLAAWAVVLYICYSIIAFVPATAEEIEESKEAGNTVMGTVGATTASMFAVILSAIGSILAALPGMISEALNPTLAIKTIGSRVYRIVGTGVMDGLMGILGLVFAVLVIGAIIMIAAFFIALVGTFVLGIIAIIKFFKNNVFYKKNG